MATSNNKQKGSAKRAVGTSNNGEGGSVPANGTGCYLSCSQAISQVKRLHLHGLRAGEEVANDVAASYCDTKRKFDLHLVCFRAGRRGGVRLLIKSGGKSREVVERDLALVDCFFGRKQVRDVVIGEQRDSLTDEPVLAVAFNLVEPESEVKPYSFTWHYRNLGLPDAVEDEPELSAFQRLNHDQIMVQQQA